MLEWETKTWTSSGDILSDSSRTLLSIHRKVTLTCQNSFQLQLHLTLCSWAPARVHSTAQLSKASLPWAVSLDRTICACLYRMYWGQCAGACSGHWLLFDCALGSWAPATGDVSEAVINCSSECLIPAMQQFQPVGDLVGRIHHLQAKILC